MIVFLLFLFVIITTIMSQMLQNVKRIGWEKVRGNGIQEDR